MSKPKKSWWDERIYEAEGNGMINFLSGSGGILVGCVTWFAAIFFDRDNATLTIVSAVLGGIFACGAALILHEEKVRRKMTTVQAGLLEEIDATKAEIQRNQAALANSQGTLFEKLEEAEADRIRTRKEVQAMFKIAEAQHISIIDQLRIVALKDGPIRHKLMDFLHDIARGMSAQRVPEVWHELVMSLRSSYDATIEYYLKK